MMMTIKKTRLFTRVLPDETKPEADKKAPDVKHRTHTHTFS